MYIYKVIRILLYIKILYLMQNIVGKYRIMEVLGEGTFNTVYKGEHVDTKRIVALKKMKKMNKNVCIY